MLNLPKPPHGTLKPYSQTPTPNPNIENMPFLPTLPLVPLLPVPL